MSPDIEALIPHLRCSATSTGRRAVRSGWKAFAALRRGNPVDHVWGGWGDPDDPRDRAAHALAALAERGVEADWPALRRAVDGLYRHGRAVAVQGLLRGHKVVIVRDWPKDADPCDHDPCWMVIDNRVEWLPADGTRASTRRRGHWWRISIAATIDSLSETARELAPHQRQAVNRARCAALGRPVPEWVYPPHQQLDEWHKRATAHFWGGEPCDLPGMPNGFTPAGDIRPTFDGERVTLPVAVHRATGAVVVDLDRAPPLTHRVWAALAEPLQLPPHLLASLRQRAGMQHAL